MKQILQKSTKGLVLMCILLTSGLSWGQQSISSVGVATIQNFNTIGSNATANLPTGWRIGTASNSTNYDNLQSSTSLAYGSTGTGAVTGNSPGGSINWANGITASSTDRAIGFLTTGGFSSPRSIVYAFTNNTGSTVTSLSVSWNYEKYRSGSRAFDWTFFHGSTSNPSTSLSDGNQSYLADANNTVISNPPLSVSKSVTINDLNITNGATYYLRWTYTGVGGNTNSQGLAIDDFSITLIAAPNNTPPVASNVFITGVPNVTQTLTGNYTYFDADSDPEGTSLYGWYRADDALGTNSVAIAGANAQTYTLQALDLGKFIRFEVLPVDDNDLDGDVAFSEWFGPVSLAGTPSLLVSEVLTENTLNGEIITLNLVNDEFVDATLSLLNFTLNNAPSGLSATAVNYVNATTATLTLAYDNTDFDTNITDFSISIAASELDSNATLTSANITIFADIEVLEVSGALAFINQCLGQTSAELSFTISGTSLKNANINIAALEGYTFSETALGTYTTTLSFSHAGGDLVAKTIFVKFTPNATATFNGNIVVSSLGAPNVNQAVTGTGINTPPLVILPTSASITANSAILGGDISVMGCNNITTRGVEYSLTNGFADGTGTQVSENGTFGTGVFTVNVTGLSSGTTYYYKAFATSTSGTAYSVQGTFTTNDIDAPVAVAATNIGSDNFTANWNAVAGATSYEIDVYRNVLVIDQNIAVWTFPISGTTVTPDIASANNTTKTLTVNGGTSAISSVAGLAGTFAANATGWNGGSGSKFWQIEVNTIGFNNLKLSSSQRSSGTGPRDFKVQYNIGSGWNDVSGGSVTVANDNTSGVLSDLVLPSECNNNSNVLIRWVMTSNTNVNNTAVASGGTSRIDDIYVVGDLITQEFVSGFNAFNVGNVTSYQVTGLDPETQYFYVVRAVDATSTSVNSNEIEVETNPIITWNGTAWNNGTGPTIDDDAVIAGVYVSTGNLSAKNLTVNEFLGEEEVGFTLNPGHTLTLSGALTNLGDEDNVVFSTGSHYLQTTHATNTGDVTIQQTAQIKLLDIVIWSSPVAEQNLLALSPNTLTNRFFTYNEEINNWQIVGGVATHQMGVGTAYGVRAPANWTSSISGYVANFKGVPNNGSVNITITSEHPTARYNGVGNPYPSALNLRSMYEANDGLIANAVYFYEHTLAPGTSDASNTNFGVLTLGNTTQDNVYVAATNSVIDEATFATAETAQVGQGFLVRALEGESGLLVMNNSMRVNTNSNFIRTAQNLESNNESNASLFRLQLTSPSENINQAVVAFYDYTSDDTDKMDTQTLGAPIYTLHQNRRLAVQGRSLPLDQTSVIPLGYNAGVAGDFSISITETKGMFDSAQYVILYDTELQVYHNLSLGAYTFTTTQGRNDQRFYLMFLMALNSGDFETTSTQVMIWSADDYLQIKSLGTQDLKEIVVYDLTGRIIDQQNVSSNVHTLTTLRPTESIVIVKTTLNDGTVATHKVKY